MTMAPVLRCMAGLRFGFLLQDYDADPEREPPDDASQEFEQTCDRNGVLRRNGADYRACAARTSSISLSDSVFISPRYALICLLPWSI